MISIIFEPPDFENIAYIVSYKNFVFFFVCACVSLSLSFVSLRGGHCHHQMIIFQKIYSLFGLEHHTVEINV